MNCDLEGECGEGQVGGDFNASIGIDGEGSASLAFHHHLCCI